MAKARIPVVEDEKIVSIDLQHTLKRLGYEVSAAAESGEEAIQKAKETRPDVVLMDIVLKGEIDGIEAATNILTHLDIPVIYMTAYSDEDTIRRTQMTSPSSYISKPFEEKDLDEKITKAIEVHKKKGKLKILLTGFLNPVIWRRKWSKK